MNSDKPKKDPFEIDLDELFGTTNPDDDKEEEKLVPFELSPDEDTVKTDPPCLHPHKYLNRVSPTLQFMYCPDCKKELKE